MIVKTQRKLEIGDELLPWANSDEEHDEFEQRIENARAEVKALPIDRRHITFIMRKEYRDSRPQNSKILYKRSIVAFNPKTGAPDYKDHTLKFNWGMIRTSNYEEIAFLDMHNKWFIREENRELTPTEKLAKENAELKAKLAALQNIEQQKQDIISETEIIEKEIVEPVEEIQQEEKPAIKVEKKESKRGRPKKT